MSGIANVTLVLGLVLSTVAQGQVRNGGLGRRGANAPYFTQATVETLREAGWTCPDADDWPWWWSAYGRDATVEDGGFVCGAMTARSLVEIQTYVDLITARLNLQLEYDNLLDVMALGHLEQGASMPAFQPDVDLDGDGLERYYDDSEDGTPKITLCVDGDGTEIRGTDCVLDPRMQDAFSYAFMAEAIWARLREGI